MDREVISTISVSQVPRAMRSAQAMSRVVRKVFAHSGVITTSAGGFITQQALCGNNSVQAATNWAASSGGFLEYRVVAIEMFVFPIVNCQTNLTTPAPTMLAMAGYASGYASTTYDEVASAAGAIIVDGRKPWKFMVTSRGNLDGSQWTATNVAIPSGESYGIIIAGDLAAPAAVASSTYFRWTAKYLTELRSLD